MANIQAVRRIRFCCGHRVLGHEGKCAHLHGHNYAAFFHAESEGLDSIGRVIDFSVLKDKLGTWIDDNWDHGFVYSSDDTEVDVIFSQQLPTHKRYVLPGNPTAEIMARYLLEEVGPRQLEDTGVRLVKVVLWETENCFAEVRVSDL
jgi:6-pyruvoyltetrahydropterin/6-carboxytetrahydropterin synthase